MSNTGTTPTFAAAQATLLQRASASRRLAKLPLCLLIACSAAFGGIQVAGVSNRAVLLVFLGVLLLAMGAATLNSLQEIKTDGCMQRTKQRPLVQGELSKRFALWQAALFVGGGLLVLQLASQSPVAPVLGLLALLLYNGCYTPLKQVSLCALVPGALCGAIPPLIGLTAVGGKLFSQQAFLLSALLILWQVPHFFLVQLRHKRDYQLSVQPNFLRYFAETGLRKMAVVWISALGFVMLLFTVTPMVTNILNCCLVVTSAVTFTVFISSHLLSAKRRNYRLLFISLNAMLVTHMLLLTF